jgi:hypothetical protein
MQLDEGENLTTRTKSLVNLLAPGLLLEIIVLCLIFSYLLIDSESMISLLVFDFLFLTLNFYLNGKTVLKLGLLALGNLVGILCNLIFFSFHTVGVAFFGGWFNVLYAISYPIMNMLWIVSFWSLSLAALPKPQYAKPAETS